MPLGDQEFKPSPFWNDYEDFRQYSYGNNYSLKQIPKAAINYVLFDVDGTIWTVRPAYVVQGLMFKKLISRDEAIVGDVIFDPETKKTVEVSTSTVTLHERWEKRNGGLPEWWEEVARGLEEKHVAL